MASILSSVTGYFKSPESPQLCGQHKDTFCYLSIRDRHPISITKIIDQTFKMGCSNSSLEQDTKDVAAKLSRLKSRLQTDKKLELLEGEGEDVDIWNNAVKQLPPDSNTWFTAPWLFVECYMYRVIHQAFQDTASFTYPSYDTFREDKCKGLQDSLSNMSKIASLLLNQPTDAPAAKFLADFIKLSLWGNRADLSILKYFDLELADVTDSTKGAGEDMVLCDHLDRVVGELLALKGGQVGIILDNSGYELFGDMCLAEVILRTTRVSSVTFHMKSIPWFRSDVTEGDMEYMLDSLRGSGDTSLTKLGNLWETRFTENKFIRTDHVFWSSPYGFCQMKTVSPELYSDLSKAEFLFFKGDLNYRKLVNDRKWPYDTSFTAALEGFTPAKLCALRTIKSDSIVNCDVSRVEKIVEEDKGKDKLFCGAYALISSNIA